LGKKGAHPRADETKVPNGEKKKKKNVRGRKGKSGGSSGRWGSAQEGTQAPGVAKVKGQGPTTGEG